jgi:hypothetical protein
MDLEKMQAEIRPRRESEAVDMGFAMIRQWFGPIYASWLATSLPVILLIVAALYKHPAIAWLVIWWLKPLLDRVPLHVISRSLFGSVPSWRETMLELPRIWGRKLHEALILQRFDSVRSFTMPVYQLEGLKGAERRARITVLGRKGRSAASRMTFIMASAEAGFVFALVTLAAWVVPAEHFTDRFNDHLESLLVDGAGSDTLFVNWVFVAGLILSMLIIEPIFVAGGFCLYLNRRTWLEAWDIELAFKKMRARIGKPVVGASRTTAVLIAFFLMFSFPSIIAHASPSESIDSDEISSREEPARDADAEPTPDLKADNDGSRLCVTESCLESRDRIGEITSDPVFGSVEDVEFWRLRSTDENEEAESYLLQAIGETIAATLQPLLWVGLLLCVIALLLMRTPRAALTPARSPADEAAPTTVLGLDLRRPSLPKNLLAAARELVDEKKIAEAVSLLFRGALADLVVRDKVSIRGGMTEGECIRLVRGTTLPERAACFESLTEMWIVTAYGHRLAPIDQVEMVLSEWPRHFKEPA